MLKIILNQMNEDYLLDNVRMLQILKQRYFPDSSWRNSIVLFLKSDFFNGDSLTSKTIDCFVNYSISTFSQFFLFLIFVKSLYRTLTHSGSNYSVQHCCPYISLWAIPNCLCWLHFLIILVIEAVLIFIW